MAATFTVNDARAEEFGYSGTADSLTGTWNKDYQVDVSGTEAEIRDVQRHDVLNATGLPTVNQSVYTIDGEIVPYMVCRSKVGRRNPERLGRWDIKTMWRGTITTDESDFEPMTPPATLGGISPIETARLGETEKVMYEDINSKACLTPNDQFWAEPMVERIPTLVLQISQYESSLTYDQALARKLKVNDDTYRSQPRYDWLITEVEFTEVTVQLSGGPTTAALVTYTLEHSPHLYGWKEDRALIDTVYDDSGDLKAFADDGYGAQSYGFVSVTGAKSATLVRDQWELQNEIDFSSFLQV